MSLTEQELLSKIEEMEVERLNARLRIVKSKQDVMTAESDLIEYSINKDRFIEQLRLLKLRTVNYELSDQDKDIERFRLILPDLIKKI